MDPPTSPKKSKSQSQIDFLCSLLTPIVTHHPIIDNGLPRLHAQNKITPTPQITVNNKPEIICQLILVFIA